MEFWNFVLNLFLGLVGGILLALLGSFCVLQRKISRIQALGIPVATSKNIWIGNFEIFRGYKEHIDLMEELCQKHYPIFAIRGGLLMPFVRVVALTPQDQKEALKEGVKGPPYNGIRRPGKQEIFTADGEFWKTERKALNPAFSQSAMKRIYPSMLQVVKNAAEAIESQINKEIDIDDLCSSISLDIIGLAIWGQDFGAVSGKSTEIKRATAELMRMAGMGIKHPLGPVVINVAPFLGKMEYRKVEKLDAIGENLAMEQVRKRQEDPEKEKKNDLLSIIANAVDQESGYTMTERQASVELNLMITAGHETSGHSMAWVFYYLSKHTDDQQRVFQELQTVLQEREVPEWHELGELKFLSACIKEAMRLMPAAGFGGTRWQTKSIVLSGKQLDPETAVWVPVLPVMRHPRLWDAPEEWRPERFLEIQNHPSFLPFSGGPRVCIGQSMAKQEMLLACAALLKRFKFSYVENQVIEPIIEITLKPRYGILLRAEKRV